MRRAAVLLALALFVSPAAAADPPARLSAPALAARIDELIAARLRADGFTPAPLADDAEFVRRVHLDLVGRIPDILTTRDFIDNPAKGKRAELVGRLLGSGRYAIHWANVWRRWILPDESSNPQLVYALSFFEAYLRSQLSADKRYDQIVREILTADVRGVSTTNPSAFYQAYQFMPENLAAAASRVFLGVKLECAQCHNHPHAKWKRQQFWEFAAFFNDAGLRRFLRRADGAAAFAAAKPGEITIPGTGRVARSRFLDGKEPANRDAGREELVAWMTARENPYFARAAVNRVWEYLVGTGLVEPLDEESDENPPSHPELLTLLAKQFAANGYDLKYLLRAITLSQTYQRTSRQTHPRQADPRGFARMRVRGLSPEQVYDSLALATGQKDEDPAYNPYLPGRANLASPRQDFLRRFPNQDKRTEQETSILQALYLMNGKIVAEATSLEHNKNLAIIAEAASVPTARRIQQLFLITLNRKPTPDETARLARYVEKGGPSGNPPRALCDVFWALLNSSEFCVNH